MRDDLHKTVSLGKGWSAVLRRLSRDKFTPDLLAPCIVETVQNELFNVKDPGWQCIESVLQDREDDLFENRNLRMMSKLHSIHESGLSVPARICCEAAIGVLAADGWTPSILSTVMSAAGTAYACDQCEHIVSEVSLKYTPSDAREVSYTLNQSLGLCDFTGALPRVPKPKKSVDELLDTELDLIHER